MLSFNQLKKNLKKDILDLKQIKIALISDTATQLLAQAIVGYGIENKISFDLYEANYNQIDFEVFNNNSGLYQFKPDYVLIINSSEKIVSQFYTLSHLQKLDFATTQIDYLQSICNAINSNINTKIIANNYYELDDAVFGNFAAKTNISFQYQIKKLNLLLMDYCREQPNLHLLNIASLISEMGYSNAFDAKMYYGAAMNLSIDILPAIAKNVCDIINATTGNFKKCIVLDLDNTIWGGIIGDDGIENIEIGNLGLGKAFTDLQTWIKQLIGRGIIVAVCSKNDETIAKQPFLQHKEMVLKLEDIAVFVANWNNKVDNIKHIQTVLNISFDAMVFIDDNPFEREMVATAIKEITVPNLPTDPVDYLCYLRGLNLFETASYTATDTDRTKQYQQAAERIVLQKTYSNENDFLESLEMKCEVENFNDFNLPRVAQLFQRSNQFNLRTIRYSEAELKQIATAQNRYSLSLSLADKFGDYGLICAIILNKKNSTTLFIDSWIMSCRVLCRGIELFAMQQIIAYANENGFNKIEGEYLPTKKNELVRNHYQNLGFILCNDNVWSYDIAANNKPENEHKIFRL